MDHGCILKVILKPVGDVMVGSRGIFKNINTGDSQYLKWFQCLFPQYGYTWTNCTVLTLSLGSFVISPQ